MLSTIVKVLDVLGIVVFAVGAFAGYALTAFAPIRPGAWWLWPALRVLLQLGGGTWLGIAMMGLMDASRFKGALIFGVLSLLLCYNPLLDLARGPLRVDGTLVEGGMHRGTLMRGSGAQSPTIHGRIVVEDESGQRWTLRPMGLQANRLDDLLAECQGERVHVEALRYLDVVMTLRCSR